MSASSSKHGSRKDQHDPVQRISGSYDAAAGSLPQGHPGLEAMKSHLTPSFAQNEVDTASGSEDNSARKAALKELEEAQAEMELIQLNAAARKLKKAQRKLEHEKQKSKSSLASSSSKTSKQPSKVPKTVPLTAHNLCVHTARNEADWARLNNRAPPAEPPSGESSGLAVTATKHPDSYLRCPDDMPESVRSFVEDMKKKHEQDLVVQLTAQRTELLATKDKEIGVLDAELKSIKKAAVAVDERAHEMLEVKVERFKEQHVQFSEDLERRLLIEQAHSKSEIDSVIENVEIEPVSYTHLTLPTKRIV